MRANQTIQPHYTPTAAEVAIAHSHLPVAEVLARFERIARATGAWTPQLIEAYRLVALRRVAQ